MKSLILILISIYTFATAQSITILQNGQSYQCGKHDTCFVLDANTFGNYHYTASQYVTLKKDVRQLDSLLISQDSITQNLEGEYHALQTTYQSEIKNYSQAVTALDSQIASCATANKQLSVSYQKLETKTKRVKMWRNIFMGASLFLTTILIILH